MTERERKEARLKKVQRTICRPGFWEREPTFIARACKEHIALLRELGAAPRGGTDG